jgi:tRNA G46 methylase TrmB
MKPAVFVTYLLTILTAIQCSAFIVSPPGDNARRQTFQLRDTMYTLNDEVCPPTEEKVLRGLITRSCSSLEKFLENKPIAAHTQVAFDAIKDFIDPTKDIVLDSGCGTGRSTVLLGELHPDKQVIGIDRSFVRLNKNGKLRNEEMTHEESLRPFQAVTSNTLLVRAELADFWRCCLQEEWSVSHHYMLYPNPYPTKARIKQRWYGHPAFPLILQLGGEIMVRSNWNGFLQEFALSVNHAHDYYVESGQESNPAVPYLLDAQLGPIERLDKSQAWTNFEKKYDDSVEPTYELLLRQSTD